MTPSYLLPPAAPDIADHLRNLRQELVRRLALLVVIVNGLALWWALSQEAFPLVAFGLWAVLLGLGAAVHAVNTAHPLIARHLLTWGLTSGLLVGMWLFSGTSIPFFAVVLVSAASLLVSGSQFAIGMLVIGYAVWLTQHHHRSYPVLDLVIVVTLSAVVAWLAVRSLYTALAWAWDSQQRADRLLTEAREQRAVVSRANQSLEQANAQLRRARQEAANARQHAETARRLKEQFAANISHELRTPLISCICSSKAS